MWVEPDGNLLSGESWARQLLYGQRYFRSRFGKTVQVCWLPDTFGYTANLPQILRQGGIDSFFTTKLNWNETNRFPNDLYHWEGIDGSRVIAHSFLNPGQGYNGNIVASDLGGTWKNFKGKTQFETSLFSYGWGDGGGGPTQEMLERYERLKDFPVTVDYVNRFKSTKEKKDTLERLKEGKIDIIIGTHALLGKEVKFKDLGIMVIDEEQKFGVGAKEKLGKLKGLIS